MAEGGARPSVEQRRDQPSLAVQGRVTDGIDARMDSMEATGRDPARHRGVGEAAATELRPAHEAPLARRQLGNANCVPSCPVDGRDGTRLGHLAQDGPNTVTEQGTRATRNGRECVEGNDRTELCPHAANLVQGT